MAFIVLRCIILYFVVALALRVMGKRQIGELQPSELVITLLFSELASIPVQDVDMPLLYGIVPILALAAIEILVSSLTLKSTALRKLVYGKPIILVYEGKPDQKAMEKARVTIDDLLEAMHTNGVTLVSDVNFAILETNGNMSIIPKNNLKTDKLPEVLIIDGKLMKNSLRKLGEDEGSIGRLLSAMGIASIGDVFFLSKEPSGKTHLIKKESKN